MSAARRDGKPSRSQRIHIDVLGASPTVARQLRRAATFAISCSSAVAARIEVVVTRDAGMIKAHREWKGMNTPTDVLTFDLSPNSHSMEATILVCKDEAARSAHRHGTTLLKELLLYVVHGCLHLCGYDDVRATEAKRMHAREDELLTELGIGPVFKSRARRAPGRAAAPKRGRR